MYTVELVIFGEGFFPKRYPLSQHDNYLYSMATADSYADYAEIIGDRGTRYGVFNERGDCLYFGSAITFRIFGFQ